MRRLVVLACLAAAQACSQHEGTLCAIRECVYHDGWKTCAELVVRTDGQYAYTTHWIWASSPSNSTFSGALPAEALAVLRQAVYSSGGFRKTNGTPTYEIGLDDSMTRHPDGVLTALSVVHAACMPAVADEKAE